MVEIRIDDTRARRLLRKAAKASADLRPVWGDLNANVIQRGMLQRWASRGSHLGSPWKPISPRTKAQRVRRGGNRGGLSRPLWDTGRLRGSWVKRGPESIYASDKLRFERGTTVPYASKHQQGVGVPKREIVTGPFVKHVADEAAERIAKHIVDN